MIHTSRSFTGCSTYPMPSRLFDSCDQSFFRPNIPLSATSPSLISNINTHTKYIPPHPQKGTPYHRYAVLLLPQKSHIDVPVVATDERLGFSLRTFIATYDLDPSSGGGAHMWRGEWNPAVSRMYQDLLSKPRLLTLMLWILSTLCRIGRACLWQATETRQVCGCQGKEPVFLVVEWESLHVLDSKLKSMLSRLPLWITKHIYD